MAVSRLAVLDHSRLKELQVLLEGQETLRLLAEKAAFCRGETGDFKQPEMDKWGVPRIHGKIMGTSWTKTLIIGF